MTKREIIDEIMEINVSAGPEFLAAFDDAQLGEYLSHLKQARTPRPTSGQACQAEMAEQADQFATAVMEGPIHLDLDNIETVGGDPEDQDRWEPQTPEPNMTQARMNLMRKINRLESLENQDQSWLF